MKKILILFIVAVVLFVSCGGETQQAAQPSAAASYVDGQYRAEFSANDTRGWKPYLNLTVAGGRITKAEFDYVNASGALKSQDTAYNQRMANVANTDVARFVVAANEALVARQAAPIDTVTGATTSTVNFNALAEALLPQAVAGNTATVVIPMDGIYAAETQPDARGYIARLEIQFVNDRIQAVRYDEVQKDGNTITYRKSEDPAYGERWGMDVPALYQSFADALVAAQDPNGVDGVSGATSAHQKFVELANRILAIRGN